MPKPVIDRRILAICPQATLEEIAATYKTQRIMKPNRKPNTLLIFEKFGIKREDYYKIIGLLGTTKKLTEFLGSHIDIGTDHINRLLEDTVAEANNRLKNMGDEALIKLMSLLLELSGQKEPANPQTAMAVSFNINEYLADRIPASKAAKEIVEGEVLPDDDDK